jgi:hypothetical protein
METPVFIPWGQPSDSSERGDVRVMARGIWPLTIIGTDMYGKLHLAA